MLKFNNFSNKQDNFVNNQKNYTISWSKVDTQYKLVQLYIEAVNIQFYISAMHWYYWLISWN